MTLKKSLILIFILFLIASYAKIAYIAKTPLTLAFADLEEASKISENIIQPLSFAFKENNIPGHFVPNYFLFKSDPNPKNNQMARQLLMMLVFKIFLNDQSLLSLYAYIMPLGEGQGIEYGARKFFQKSTTELNSHEVFYLEVVSRSPSRLNTEEGKKTIEAQVQKLDSSYQALKTPAESL
jgi:hypothetical protein